MAEMAVWIKIAGLVHWAIAAANIALPKKLKYRDNLSRVTPMFRQVFVVHSVYIVAVVVALGYICVRFAPELAGDEPLGRFLALGLAFFWGARLVIHLFYYDSGVRRRNRIGDLAFIAAIGYLVTVFGSVTFM